MICAAAPASVPASLSLSFFTGLLSGHVCSPLSLDVLPLLCNIIRQPLPGIACPLLLFLCSLCSHCRCSPVLAGRLLPGT